MKTLYSIVEGVFDQNLSDDQIFLNGQEFIDGWVNKSDCVKNYLDCFSYSRKIFKIAGPDKRLIKLTNPIALAKLGIPIKGTSINNFVKYFSDDDFNKDSLGLNITVNKNSELDMDIPIINGVNFNLKTNTSIMRLSKHRSTRIPSDNIIMKNCQIGGFGNFEVWEDDVFKIKNCDINCKSIYLCLMKNSDDILLDFINHIIDKQITIEFSSWKYLMDFTNTSFIDDQLDINEIMNNIGFIDCKFGPNTYITIESNDYIIYLDAPNKPIHHGVGKSIYQQILKDNRRISINQY